MGATAVILSHGHGRNRGRVRRMRNAPDANLGDFGLSLKPPKVLRNIGKTVVKAVKDTGRVAGKVLDNKLVKGAVATGLALTGVGAPAAAGIMAAQGGAAKALQGKNLKTVIRGAGQGAVLGGAAGVAGKALPKIPGVGSKVTALRQKIGKTPKPKSYESDARLDALASGKLPDVGITGRHDPIRDGMVAPALKPLPGPKTPKQWLAEHAKGVASDEAMALAKRKGAEAARIGVAEAVVLEKQAGEATAKANAARTPAERKSWQKKAADFLKSAGARKAAGVAAQMAANALAEPSSNPAATSGGFPVPDREPSAMENIAEANAAGGVGDMMKNPVVLVAGVALFALLFSQKK